MTKNILILLSVLLLAFPSSIALAQDINFVPVSEIRGQTPISLDASDPASTDTLLGDLFTVFIVIAVILSVIRLMICGIKYMTTESVSSKGAAKTCIQYVLGGLLLILFSYIILATVNSSLVTANFIGITRGIDVGDVSDLDNPGTIDRRDFDSDSDLPGRDTVDRHEVKYRNNCTGNTYSIVDPELSQCIATRDSRKSLKIWSTVRSCNENAAGNYQFTISATGVNCPPKDFSSPYTEEHPPSSSWTDFFDKDDDCEDALDAYLDLQNYTITQDCTNIGPPPGP